MKITKLAKSQHNTFPLWTDKIVEIQIKGRIPSGVSECLCFTPNQQPRTGISFGSTFFAKIKTTFMAKNILEIKQIL